MHDGAIEENTTGTVRINDGIGETAYRKVNARASDKTVRTVVYLLYYTCGSRSTILPHKIY